MYIATEDFNSYDQGKKKKGDEVKFNKTFFDAGMIEEKAHIEPRKETKPELKKAKKNKAR